MSFLALNFSISSSKNGDIPFFWTSKESKLYWWIRCELTAFACVSSVANKFRLKILIRNVIISNNVIIILFLKSSFKNKIIDFNLSLIFKGFFSNLKS